MHLKLFEMHFSTYKNFIIVRGEVAKTPNNIKFICNVVSKNCHYILFLITKLNYKYIDFIIEVFRVKIGNWS